MEAYIEKLGWKKLAMLLLVLGILLLLLIVLSVFFEEDENSTSQTIPTPSISVYAVPSRTERREGWITHETAQHSIQFPANWSIQALPVVKGGLLTTFRPISFQDKDYFPRIAIEASPYNASTSARTRANSLSVLNLSRNDVSFRDISAIQLQGVLPFREFFTGNPEQKKVIKTYLFFERENYTYVISYAYYQDENEEKNKQLFVRILETFQFQ